MALDYVTSHKELAEKGRFPRVGVIYQVLQGDSIDLV